MEMPKVTPAAEKLFTALLALDARLERRKMFGQPAAFVNGNLCLGAFGEHVFLRLSEKDLASAAAVPGTQPFEPMEGRAMRGYLVFPPALLKDPARSRPWVERSVEFTRALPPKKPKGRG